MPDPIATLRARWSAGPAAWTAPVHRVSTPLAARISGLSRSHLHALACAGRIPDVARVGLRRAIRIPSAWCEQVRAAIARGEDIEALLVPEADAAPSPTRPPRRPRRSPVAALVRQRLGEPPDGAEATSEPPEGDDAA